MPVSATRTWLRVPEDGVVDFSVSGPLGDDGGDGTRLKVDPPFEHVLVNFLVLLTPIAVAQTDNAIVLHRLQTPHSY